MFFIDKLGCALCFLIWVGIHVYEYNVIPDEETYYKNFMNIISETKNSFRYNPNHRHMKHFKRECIRRMDNLGNIVTTYENTVCVPY